MTRQWLYQRYGAIHGPLSIEDLRAAAFLGFLQPGDLVRDTKTDRWVEARSLKSLAAACQGWESRMPAARPPCDNDNQQPNLNRMD